MEVHVDVESEVRCSVVPGLEVVCSAKHTADEVELSGHAWMVARCGVQVLGGQACRVVT